ncbi:MULTISPECIES: site-specific integrase [Lentisalinibacter]|uniref:site-specific integrase n=1 Tax=Lentisalinibacter TaxID=3382081 RepID=UPI003865FEA4
MQRVRALPVIAREADPFSQEEVNRILSALNSRSKQVASYFAFAFGSGLRTSELLALTWGDIDTASRRVFVNKALVRDRLKAPKTSAGRRIVEFHEPALQLLDVDSHKTPDTRVFVDPRTGGPWKNDKAIRKLYWYPALRETGVRRRNPYQTRHTFASMRLMEGANPLYVAQQMGHKDWGMIRNVYGKYIS